MNKKVPRFNMDAQFGIGYLYKVKTHADYGKSNYEHEKAYSERFRYKEISNTYKYANLMPNFKFTDSTTMIELYDNIDIKIDDRIETKDGKSGIVGNEPIETNVTNSNGLIIGKKWVVSFG